MCLSLFQWIRSINPIFDTEISHWPRFKEEKRAAIGSLANFQKMVLPRGKPCFLPQSSVSLEGDIFLKTGLGTYRSPFFFEKSNAGRKFSIEDRVSVERSQKSFKVDEKISVKKWRFGVLKTCAGFGWLANAHFTNKAKESKLLLTFCGIILSPK